MCIPVSGLAVSRPIAKYGLSNAWPIDRSPRGAGTHRRCFAAIDPSDSDGHFYARTAHTENGALFHSHSLCIGAWTDVQRASAVATRITVFLFGNDVPAKNTLSNPPFNLGWSREGQLNPGDIVTAIGPEHYFPLLFAMLCTLKTLHSTFQLRALTQSELQHDWIILDDLLWRSVHQCHLR